MGPEGMLNVGGSVEESAAKIEYVEVFDYRLRELEQRIVDKTTPFNTVCLIFRYIANVVVSSIHCN